MPFERKFVSVCISPIFIFYFLLVCLTVYKRNNYRYKQVQTKYKRPAVLIFIFDKVERQVHIDASHVGKSTKDKKVETILALLLSK